MSDIQREPMTGLTRLLLLSIVHMEFPCDYCGAKPHETCWEVPNMVPVMRGYEHPARMERARAAGWLPIDDPTWWVEADKERVIQEVLATLPRNESATAP